MNVFLDTNILIDFVTEREGVEEASMLLQLREEHKINIYASILSMANTAYIARRGRTRAELYGVLIGLSEMIEILPMDSAQYRKALMIEVPDFEDMLQYQCAIAADCDVIVTRNKRDFAFSKLPVYTPTEYLNLNS